MKRIFFILMIHVSLVASSRILFNGMHASDSHIGSMLPFASRLSENHYVHILESNSRPNSYKYPPGINYTYIQLADDPIFAKTILPKIWTHQYSPAEFPQVFKTGDNALVEMIKEHNDEFSALLNDSWDLVIADELFAIASYGLSLSAKKRGDSFIVLTTCVSTHLMRWHLALGSTFIHRPSMFHTVGKHFEPTSFASRAHSSFHAAWINLGVSYVTNYVSNEGLKLLGMYDFSLYQLASQTSYYFVDDANLMVWPYPVSSEMVHIGNHCPAVRSLPEDYKGFLEDPESKGTILIAFGSNAKWEFAPQQIITSFVEAINNLSDYRIVFTYNGPAERVKGVGKHCKITQWAPQKEILGHHKTRLFVSHGGMKSFKDTVCGGVPVLYMPLFAEQPHNAEMARTAGFAEIVDKTQLTPESLLSGIRRVVENNSYDEAVKKFRSMFVDHPMHPLDKAAFYVRRAVKTKGRYPTFKRKGMYLPTFTYSFGDLILIVVIFMGLLMS